MNVDADQLLALTQSILMAWGMPEAAASTTAELLVETDLRAIDSHGVSMLPMYEGMHERGTLNMNPVPTTLVDTPVMMLIDADRGLGHPIAMHAMRLACDKAQKSGIAAVGVRNSHHFGAAGLYSEIAAERGLVGIVTSSTSVAGVIPTHGADPLLGTNPLSFAAPGVEHGPFVLDMSTSTVAVNKVKVYALNGRDIPAGWVVDGQGRTVTEAKRALEVCHSQGDGGVMPLGGHSESGGHKGYGLAVMVQILASSLTGGSFSPVRNREAQGPVAHNIGHLFIVVDPSVFRDLGDFERDVDQVLDVLKASKPTDPARPVLIAGDPERSARAERKGHGIPMPETLLDQLRAIAAKAGVPYTLTPA